MIFEELDKRYSPEVIKLICDYFEQLEKLNLLPEGMTIDYCWNFIKKELKDIIFFKTEEQDKYEEIKYSGNKFRGYTSGSSILYIRDGLTDSEIVFYHELTHLLQRSGMKFKLDGKPRGYLENEAVTQWVADRIYMNKYGVTLPDKEYDSGELRMLPGIPIKSYLTNYQHFDYLFSKLLESIDVTQEEVIKLSFYGDEDKVKEFWESKGLLENKNLFKCMQYIYNIDKTIYTSLYTKEDPVTKEKFSVPASKILLEDGETLTLSKEGGEKFALNAQVESKLYNSLINLMDEIKENNRSV
ncbi:MAG: hypothetical protein J6B98_07180 [Bacilli bacterium]|nr:hypothetical protein [Bacilli bacterium]